MVLLEDRQRILSVIRERHIVATFSENKLQEFCDVLLIFDHQDSDGSLGRFDQGSRTHFVRLN